MRGDLIESVFSSAGSLRGYCCEAQRFVALTRSLILLRVLLFALPSILDAQTSSSGNQPPDETLSEQVNDPLAHLTQVQIKDGYTPAEYGTDAQPNLIQFRSVFAIRSFSLIPLEELVPRRATGFVLEHLKVLDVGLASSN